MSRSTSRLVRAGTAAVLGAAAVVVPLTIAATPAGAGRLYVGSHTKILITARGQGHGHGMSQWGAKGAAQSGKTYKAILAFYYPGTTLTTLKPSTVRVKLTKSGSRTIVAAAAGLKITGSGRSLPSSGVARYRLSANAASGLTLQQLKSASGATWKTYRTGVTNRAAFHQPGGAVRVFDSGSSGRSTSYLGYVSSVRKATKGSARGVETVNRVALDQYTAGVVPREIPASWSKHAVFSQAVAARTYGRYAVEHHKASKYDLCDTNACQVYGGHRRYDSAGRVLWSDYAPAAKATANKILRFKGKTIFAQFDGSNGGWTVGNGQPYLVSKRDPYDNARSGDPHARYRTSVRVNQVASYFGLKKLTAIVVTTRDGHGEWGGRAVTGYVRGLNSHGKAVKIMTTGYGLQSALRIGTAWFRLNRG